MVSSIRLHELAFDQVAHSAAFVSGRPVLPVLPALDTNPSGIYDWRRTNEWTAVVYAKRDAADLSSW